MGGAFPRRGCSIPSRSRGGRGGRGSKRLTGSSGGSGTWRSGSSRRSCCGRSRTCGGGGDEDVGLAPISLAAALIRNAVFQILTQKLAILISAGGALDFDSVAAQNVFGEPSKPFALDVNVISHINRHR